MTESRLGGPPSAEHMLWFARRARSPIRCRQKVRRTAQTFGGRRGAGGRVTLGMGLRPQSLRGFGERARLG